MRLPIYQIDAFTTRRFSGNPAAVVVLDAWLPDTVLQAIAAENNLAETAFVVPQAEASPLRWFTPTVEVDLCGHATLATAAVLFGEHFPGKSRLVFETASGLLVAVRDGDRIALDFPARPPVPAPVTEALVAVLGRPPEDVVLARDLVAVLATEGHVRDFHPDIAGIAALNTFSLVITAKGVDADFVSRFFAPNAGIPEDPVTGSSHCTLVPYWAARLGKTMLFARQLSPRGGELYCQLIGDRVSMSGHSVEYLRGTITI